VQNIAEFDLSSVEFDVRSVEFGVSLAEYDGVINVEYGFL